MFTYSDMSRYLRQMPIIGQEGQHVLNDATVLIAGAGGLGSPIAYYLAAAGVGHIRIIDSDSVEVSNLNRQILHWDTDVGRPKVESAQEKLRRFNPDIEIETYFERIGSCITKSCTDGVDAIVDALDSYETRYVLNREALDRNIPLFHGAVSGFQGHIMTIIPGKTPCLRCVFQTPPPQEISPVIGVTTGIIGSIQAGEVLKYLLNIGTPAINRLIIWDGLTVTIEELLVTRNPHCVDCRDV
ncbi:MAG: HesA/MoeB/ThiF family protein [Methanospirillaceae archaeon]|nr:HesA/MoeB/ThiF family protein [Methanospirillaceae archaeon]